MADTKTTQSTDTPVVKPVKKDNKPLIIAIVISVILGLSLIAAVGALTFSAIGHGGVSRGAMQFERGSHSQAGMNGGPLNERRNSRMEQPMADSATRVSGVVTAINGDSIVVSGNGKQVTVNKTSSTVVKGSSTTVAVNDSVLITGNTTDGSFTATTITVRNATVQ